LGNEFEIIQCSNEEDAKEYESTLRISERAKSTNGSYLDCLYELKLANAPDITFKQSPSKQQRREWRKISK